MILRYEVVKSLTSHYTLMKEQIFINEQQVSNAQMSILFASDNGWIISHLDYLHSIYKNVEDASGSKSLKFNTKFFNINSQFLRSNQIESQNKCDSDMSCPKKKRKKNSQKLPDEVLEQNAFVETIGKKILEDAKYLKLFANINRDNNEESRLESKKFYSESTQLITNFQGSNEKETAIVTEFQNEKYVFPKNCSFYCYDIRQFNEKFHMEYFDFVLLDPPWWNKSVRRKNKKFKQSGYQMMYNEELAKIPVGNILNSNGIVAVWCTNSSSQIKSILEQMFPAWNVSFKAKWYWLKITQSGESICDFNEQHGKQPYEQILFGVKSSNINFTLPDKKLILSVPSAAHSHKPPLAEILKSFLPENPKCMEIFARYLLPNWTSWGLEVLKFQHISLYSTENKNT